VARVEVVVAQLPDGWPGQRPTPWSPRAHALASRRPGDRARSLAADCLLSLLCQRWGVSAHWYAPSGQPSCDGAHLTASHDGARVVAAIADCRAGVDVVDCRRPAAWMTRLLNEPGPDPHRAWAVREAALKWTGVGLAIDPRTLRVTRGAGDLCEWLDTWWVVHLPDGRTVPVAAGAWGHYALALAVERPVVLTCDEHVLA